MPIQSTAHISAKCQHLTFLVGTSWSTLMRLLTTGILQVPHSLHPNFLFVLLSTWSRFRCQWRKSSQTIFTVLRWVGQLRSTALQESCCTKRRVSILHHQSSVTTHHQCIFSHDQQHRSLHYHQSSWRHIGSLPHQHDLATFSHCTGLPVETCAFGKELWKEEPSRLVPSLLNIDCILICNTLFCVYNYILSYS